MILDILEDSDGLSTSEVANDIGISARATRTRLQKLVNRGLVVEISTIA